MANQIEINDHELRGAIVTHEAMLLAEAMGVTISSRSRDGRKWWTVSLDGVPRNAGPSCDGYPLPETLRAMARLLADQERQRYAERHDG